MAAPGGGFALVEDAAGGLSLIRTAGTDAASTYLRAAADQVRFSSTGSTAVFLDRASSTAEVWTGLPSAPRLQATLSAAAPSGVLSALEISDDGEICLGVSEAGDVYELSSGNAPRRSALPRRVRKVRFVPGTGDVLILDTDGLLSAASLSTGDIRPLAGVVARTFEDVVLSNDASSALAVSNTSLVLVPLDGKEPTTVPWLRGGSRIGSLRGGQFAITVAGEAGAWILDRDVRLSYVAEF